MKIYIQKRIKIIMLKFKFRADILKLAMVDKSYTGLNGRYPEELQQRISRFTGDIQALQPVKILICMIYYDLIFCSILSNE